MKYDIIIIGGGIVGLATALRLLESKPDLKLAILEKEDGVSRHQTGHNSGVIHSGIYYKPGSLKALNCRRGYQQLIEFCDRENIKYELCGKLIVATYKEELPALENIYKRGLENGLEKIRKLSAGEMKEYEPHAYGLAAIHVPYTGIIDYLEVSEKMAEIITKKYGAEIHLNSKVTGIKLFDGYSEIQASDGVFTTRLGINTAGLFSDQIAEMNMDRVDVRIIPFRGEYYEIRKEKEYLVKNLIYPVPDPNFPFLGVHYTRMIHGGVEAGPNAVFAFKKEGYKKSDISLRDLGRSLSWTGYLKVMLKYWKMGLGEYWRSYNKNAFTKALQRMLPEIRKEDLIPGGSGVRAQACDRKGNLADDFLFVENEHIINVLNAPSPAATASLSIGRTIADKALERLS
jgi:(S)-2-hydroxyglutarate dehydrogenase